MKQSSGFDTNIVCCYVTTKTCFMTFCLVQIAIIMVQHLVVVM